MAALKNVCRLGGESERAQFKHSDKECMCNQSCEPHIHEGSAGILCLHDGETEHLHCPNNPFNK